VPIEVGSTRIALGRAGLPWPEPPRPEPAESAPEAPLTANLADNWPAIEEPKHRFLPRRWERYRLRAILLAAVLALAGGGVFAWSKLRQTVDPAAVLRGILAEMRLPEINVFPDHAGYLLKGFLETEAERDALLKRVKGFTPPVKTRIVSAEETRASILGVLDIYHLDLPIEIGPMGKAVITGICDDSNTIKELSEAVRQGVQSETEVQERFHGSGTVIPYTNKLLAAKVLDYKVRLELDKGRLAGVLVKNQMDSADMAAWRTVRASFRSQFGMDLEEKWTDRPSPALLRLSSAVRELDTQLVGVTVGEMSYITLRNRRKFFEGAKLSSGLTVKSIQRDRIVLSLGNVEQNYFLKKGSR
jgi:type III secretion system YscD/HrpQ family protein